VIYLKIIFQYLPELIALVKSIINMTNSGIEEVVIKRRLKKIDKAFNNPNRVEAARELNDAFKD